MSLGTWYFYSVRLIIERESKEVGRSLQCAPRGIVKEIMGRPHDGVLAVIIIKDGGDLYLLWKENAQDKILCEKASLQNSMNYLIPFMKIANISIYIYPCNTYLLNTSYVPSTLLGARGTAVNSLVKEDR